MHLIGRLIVSYKSIHTLFIFSLLFLIIPKHSLYAQNWPMLNYDRERTSWVKDENILQPPFELKTEINIKSAGQKMGDLSFYNNLLCLAVQNEPNTLEVHDIVSNDTLWTFEVPGSVGSMSFTCAQNDSLIFAGGQRGVGLYALYRESGKEKWKKPVGSLYTKNVILDSTRLYILGDSLYCLSIEDGSTIWSKPMIIQTTPAVDDSYLYVTGQYKMQIFDKYKGNPIWERPTSERTTAGITVDASTFYTHSNDTVFAYNKKTWDIKWSYHSIGDTLQYAAQNSISITDTKLCFTVNTNGEGNGQLVVLDKSSGKFIWEHTFGGNYVFAPAIANGVLYIVPFGEKALYGFDLENGNELFYDKSVEYRNQPIVANHELYAAGESQVVVFKNITTDLNNVGNPSLQDFKLQQNYPNPFNPQTTIGYSLPEKSPVKLRIYNISGQEVAILVDKEQAAGNYQVDFNARNQSSGIYFYELSTRSVREVKRMLLIK